MDNFHAIIPQVLLQLAERRPLFHAEADFQYEFARELYSLAPECEIRLERPVRISNLGTFNVDMVVRLNEHWHAVELKYVTAGLVAVVAAEEFRLKPQAAQDARRYDVIKDVRRIETLIEHGVVATGVSVTVTNDRSLWSESRHLDPVDAAFRLHHGRLLEGSLAWNARASKGTQKGREAAIGLFGSFPLEWSDFSNLTGERNGLFRKLVVFVE